MVKVCVGLMAGTAQAKYRELIHGCCRTWVQDYGQAGEDVYMFCGQHTDYAFEEAMSSITDGHAKFIHLNGIKDDYISATVKQWYGLAYMRQTVEADFYVIIGTDNYVNKDKLENVMGKYSADHPCLIGGYTEVRNVGFMLSFPFGGGGLSFSRTAVDELLLTGNSNRMEGANSIINNWMKLCNMSNNKLECACDVAAAFFCWIKDIASIKEKSLYPCSWTGKFCNPDMEVFPMAMDHNNIAICHYMTYDDMLIYRKYLKADNVTNYINFIRFYQSKLSSSKSFRDSKWTSSIIHHPKNVLIVGDDDGNMLYHIIMDWLSYDSNEDRTVIYTDISLSKFNALKDICKNLTGINIIKKSNLSNRTIDIVYYNSLHCYGNLKKILDKFSKDGEATVSRSIVIFGNETFSTNSELCGLDTGILSENYDLSHEDLVEGMERAIDEFLSINTNWSEDIIAYTNHVANNKLNNTNNSSVVGGVLFLNNDNYLPKIYDITLYCIEKDILKLRVKELYEYVDQFIVLEGGIVNSTAEPRERTYKDIDGLEIYKDKIRYVELDHSEKSKQCKDQWVREAYFRDYPMYKLGLEDDAILIVCDVDEVWDHKVVIPWLKENYNTMGGGVYTLSMIFHYYNFNWIKKFKWDMPFLGTFKSIREHGAEDIRKMRAPRSGKINDAGWHLSYFGDADNLIKKVSMFCHQEFNKSDYMNKDHIEKCIETGIDIFNRGDGENLTKAVNVKRPYKYKELPEIFY